MFKLSPFRKKLQPEVKAPEPVSYTLEVVTQAYEADITYRRLKVFTATQLLITDRKGIKVGDIMVCYSDGKTDILTPTEVAKRQKEGTL